MRLRPVSLSRAEGDGDSSEWTGRTRHMNRAPSAAIALAREGLGMTLAGSSKSNSQQASRLPAAVPYTASL